MRYKYKVRLAWLFFSIGLCIFMIEGFFTLYSNNTQAVITYIPENMSRLNSHPVIEFTDDTGIARHAKLRLGFINLKTDTAIETGDTVTIKYLSIFPAYARDKSSTQFFRLIGVIFTLIGLGSLILQHKKNNVTT